VRIEQEEYGSGWEISGAGMGKLEDEEEDEGAGLV
jgi:hypothetical protein